MSGEDDGFLSRWSRRKRGGAEEEPDEAPRPDAPDAAAGPSEEIAVEDPQGAEEEAAVLERLGLPDPDTLEQGADFSVFMARSVPEVIRRRALRRLWRSNPTLAVLDGLNDYDGDFTGGFVKPGTLQTAYQVGKGIVQKVVEATDTADEGETGPAAPRASSSVRPPETIPEPVPEAVVQAQSDASQPLEETPGAEEETGDEARVDSAETEAEEAPRPTRRRMAFRFGETGSG
jgi:hypothetical protein